VDQELVTYLPWIPAGLIAAIEWYGHRHEAPWVAELGVPFGGTSETLDIVVPLPVPDGWLSGVNIVSRGPNRIAFAPHVGSEASATCIGVVTFTPYAGTTTFRYRCLLRPWVVAAIAALGSTVALTGVTRSFVLVVAAVAAAFAGVIVLSHKRKCDAEYFILSAEIARRAGS
jgi:hypothetical protein